jgi:outer membrane protein assembly factor BamD (BamD/ComL family)
LLRQADDARRAGQRERAAELLERVVRQAPSSPHAALAALTLARLVMTDEPARAARALAAVRDSAASSGVREDLMARLVEARAREGRGDLAREAADQYIRDFPHGTRLDEVRQWASAPRP